MALSDYKEMYRILFQETTRAISILQAAQERTEAIYINEDAAVPLLVMKPDLVQGEGEKGKPSP